MANFFLVFDLEIVPWNPFGTYAVPLYTLVFAYAIVRHRLLDINLVIARTAILVFCYIPLLLTPIILGILFQPLLALWLGQRWWIAPTALEALFAVIGLMAYRHIQGKAEAKLLKEQRRYQATLMNAAKGMTRIHDLQHLLDMIVHMLTRAMKLTHAGIFLFDEKTGKYVLQASRDRDVLKPGLTMAVHNAVVEWLKDEQAPIVQEEIAQLANVQRSGSISLARLDVSLREIEASVVVPSFAEDQLIGFLALGNKKNGQMYSQDDLNVLQTLANQAALAIQNARFYEEEKERQAALFHTASLASLGTMASSMSHQVNNRFNVISLIGSSQKDKLDDLLKSNSQDAAVLRKALEEDRAQFKSLLEEAMRGGEIVSAIRKIGKPSRDGYKPVTLSEALNVGLDIVRYKVHLEEIDFLRNVPQDLAPVQGDLAQLGECFLNLLDNAYDAIQEKASHSSPGYKGMIHIAARETLNAKKRWVVVDVSDNGIGMDDKTREGLFVPFFTTKATAEKGTGLGLYVIKKIIEAHGGMIAVSSVMGQGTAFTLKLPAALGGSSISSEGSRSTG